ncbi:flagellar assembly protein FliH [Marinomonas sp. M1K-6]|uniref:Flagellar assembly protein FliH n=1 Tax=Marinomonas profundi TaxID=2726122 RepID=A0A847R6J2_9GAMM|nr:FliH/SctL family protein [Marinomonas profundi]NLQ16534.1 flagellar assembly protein FliH [Marinomonas profundi]UDV03877.1 flagellar assembly protein FliH [Marinomonas profundi]
MSDKQEKSERKLTAYERWELPHLENNKPSNHSGPAILIQKDTMVTTEEVDQDSLVYEPLTASQLEEIRSAAYEEGFIQGEEEGHKKGHDDGFSKGEVDGFEKGHGEGRAIGIEEGLTQARAEAQIKLEALETLFANMVKEITQPLEDSRSAVENILYQSMNRMIENVCLSKMHEDGHKILKEQLSKVFDCIGEYEGRVRLRLHPDDVSILEELGVKDRLTLQLEMDDTLISGGFVIDSKSFHIDGRVEQRLTMIFEELSQLSLPEQD